MASVKFTVFNPATGAIVRSGVCPAELLPRMNRPGCSLLTGVRAHPDLDTVERSSDGMHEIKRRPAARRMPLADPLTVLIHALKKKGIAPTEGELRAARDELRDA